MHLPPFELDVWLTKYKFASPPIRYDLASSTGPRWTVRELLDLGGEGARAQLESLASLTCPRQAAQRCAGASASSTAWIPSGWSSRRARPRGFSP